ncbi:TauD/TfdA family dioxygenase [Actinospica robiniae]|uniref:TauD/TfdA family dioxygenase n=1 Tax=Actinospica robiniae TaxID=304901 RepID=UPI00042983BB|nr:TauD/TfdA family dioxygenase [Actinospica robiniae]
MTERMLPAVVEAAGSQESVTGRIRAEHDEIHKLLVERGAVLLRGFEIGGVDGFDAVVRELSGAPLTYSERSSPRSTIKGQVYTSTDYPPNEEIFLHNENSYQAVWPLTLYFYCITAPLTLGATPLADIGEVYRSIDPDVREEFRRRRWTVVRNFHPDFGVQWQHVFNTEDRDAVARYCAGRGIELEWRDGGGLRTRAVRDAVHRHPVTGEETWFNHATFFHITTQAADVQTGLRTFFADEDLPTNTYYGDGGRIPDDVMEHLRGCYQAARTRFDYRAEDVLVVDNMRVAHGRESFTGPRKVAVAMATPSG